MTKHQDPQLRELRVQLAKKNAQIASLKSQLCAANQDREQHKRDRQAIRRFSDRWQEDAKRIDKLKMRISEMEGVISGLTERKDQR